MKSICRKGPCPYDGPTNGDDGLRTDQVLKTIGGKITYLRSNYVGFYVLKTSIIEYSYVLYVIKYKVKVYDSAKL
jgi:hypothetical protein